MLLRSAAMSTPAANNAPVAIITGAGSGIGRATAELLDRSDYRVTLVGRTAATLDATAAGLSGPLVVPADVTNASQVADLVDRTIALFGRLDAVVNNAGALVVKPIAEMTDAEWRTTIDTNLSAAFYLCRAAWRVFATQKSGVIVNISSPAARDPFTGLGAYGTAKAGLSLLGLVLAREGKPLGIRVHTVSPGATETAMFRQIVTPQQYPTDQTLDPRDVAEVIVRCVKGDPAYVSGEVIDVAKSR